MLKPKNTIKRDGPPFHVIGLNAGFKLSPKSWPKLEIFASALWFDDSFPRINAKVLERGIAKAIEDALKAEGAS